MRRFWLGEPAGGERYALSRASGCDRSRAPVSQPVEGAGTGDRNGDRNGDSQELTETQDARHHLRPPLLRSRQQASGEGSLAGGRTELWAPREAVPCPTRGALPWWPAAPAGRHVSLRTMRGRKDVPRNWEEQGSRCREKARGWHVCCPTVPPAADQEPPSCHDDRPLLPGCSVLCTGVEPQPGLSQELQGCPSSSRARLRCGTRACFPGIWVGPL